MRDLFGDFFGDFFGVARGVIYGLIVVTALMTAAAWGVWWERKFVARMQNRKGPNRVGPAGLLQPLADLLKLLQKERVVPGAVDRRLFAMAPALTVLLALVTAAAVPFGPELVAADLDVGLVYVLAVGALLVVPVFMAGWGSANKYALLGGMRAIAQAISYEVPLVLAALVPVAICGSMNLSEIVRYQSEHHWLAVWPTVPGLPAFVLFIIALLAESNRIPFDIPEAESELVAGVTTEYTGMGFGLLLLAEYLHTLVGSAVAVVLFLGGWDGPFFPGVHWMVGKTLLLFTAIYALRWSLLRFRSDQLMDACWRVLVPVGVGLVVVAALYVQFWPGAG